MFATAVRVAVVSVHSLPPGRTEISVKRLRVVHAGGGNRVNEAFEALLREGVTDTDWARLHHSDRLELGREFETRKRFFTNTDSTSESFVSVSLQVVVARLRPNNPADFVRNVAKVMSLSAVRSGRFKPSGSKADGVQSEGTMLRLRHDFVTQVLFSGATAAVAEELRDALRQPQSRGAAAIVVFGGFAQSDSLVDSLRNAVKLTPLNSIPLVVAPDPELAVARGAAIVTHGIDLSAAPAQQEWPIGIRTSVAADVS